MGLKILWEDRVSDIVERLRAKHIHGAFEIEQQRQEAANEIERLRRESRERLETLCATNDRLVAALEEVERANKVVEAARITVEASESEWEDAVTNLDLEVMRHDNPGGHHSIGGKS
jgi:uncharacterized phage protein gp47/JayE